VQENTDYYWVQENVDAVLGARERRQNIGCRRTQKQYSDKENVDAALGTGERRSSIGSRRT
jgi:hypothetical protein